MKRRNKSILLFTLAIGVTGCGNTTPLPPIEEPDETPKDTVSEYLKLNYYRDSETLNSAEGLILIDRIDTLPTSSKKIVLKWGDDKSSFSDYNPLIEYENINASEFEYQFMDNALIPFDSTKLWLEVLNEKGEVIDKASLGFEKYKKQEELKYRFEVISDQQIKTGVTGFYRRSKTTFEDIKENSKDSIGIFVNGDVVDEATSENYKSFYKTYNDTFINKEIPLHVGIGNHEFIKHSENPNYEGMSENEIETKFNERLELWKKETGNKKQYFSFVENDAKFVFLGTTKMPMSLGGNTRADCHLGEEQLNWLKNEVDSHGDKPIFIMSHGSLRDTVSGSLSSLNQTWYGYSLDEEKEIRKIIDNKKNVFFFSSHSHWCFESENPYLLNQSGPNFFNTAAIGYLWEGKGQGKHYKDGDYENGGAQGLYVEVYESQIFIKGRQFEDVDGHSKYWHSGYQVVVDCKE